MNSFMEPKIYQLTHNYAQKHSNTQTLKLSLTNLLAHTKACNNMPGVYDDVITCKLVTSSGKESSLLEHSLPLKMCVPG